MEIKKEYDNLKKKLDLPDFKTVNHEFEIETLDEEGFILRNIRRRIAEKLEGFSKILEEILQPEASISNLIECKVFSEVEKKEISDLYRNVMFFIRQSTEAGIKTDDKEDAKFISQVLKEWNVIKNEMAGILEKIKECWKEDIDVKEELEYLG